jgi:hypothetical protein
MSCLFFSLSTGFANRIEKLHWDFLWGGLGEEFKYHLVIWSKVCSLIFEGGWGFIICSFSIVLFGGSGFDAICMRERERLCGKSSWILNVVAHGVSGALMRFMSRLGWGYGKISGVC